LIVGIGHSRLLCSSDLPSGCGKSTTLRIIAGLEAANSGDILIGGKRVNNQPPAKRDIAMVFQSYALFPHLSVAENILFGLKVRRVSKTDQAARLNSMRNAMRSEIRDLQRSLGFSMVYVTHDQTEAITMADKVVLMKDGRVEQSGTPKQIYEEPATSFVAGFIGTPPMNLFPANDLLNAKGMQGQADSIMVGIRPEHISLSDGSGIHSEVQHVEYLGADVLADCRIGESVLVGRIEGQSNIAVQSTVSLGWSQSNMHFFDSTTGVRLERTPDIFLNFFSD